MKSEASNLLSIGKIASTDESAEQKSTFSASASNNPPSSSSKQSASQNNSPGPHEITRTYRKYEDIPPPFRKPHCQNYSACLDIAACLDWDSFTCANCTETIEPALLWRMRSAIKKDKLCQQLFTPPALGLLCNQDLGTQDLGTQALSTENLSSKD